MIPTLTPTIIQEQEALEKQPETNLSLEAQVFLAFKYKHSNRYKLLGQLTRANFILDNQLMDKTKFLHPKACVIAEIIMVSLVRKGVTKTSLTSQELSKITNCLEKQNRNILKQLRNLLEFKYQRKYLENNPFYIFKINPKVNEILESSAAKKGGVL